MKQEVLMQVKRVASMMGTMGLISLLTPAAVVLAQSANSTAVPTFAEDVAPILHNKCAICHRPGEIAPMSLLSYDDVRPWARAIKSNVATRVMPPWGADHRYGKFSNDASLTQAEIDTIVRWVDGGAPKGRETDLPPVPEFASGWRGGEPDHVFEMPVYEVQGEGEVQNQYFWVQNPFPEDMWVERLELWPGNQSVVHHIRVDIVNLPEEAGYRVVNSRLIDPNGREVTGDQGGRTADGLFLTAESTFYLIAYVPGNGVQQYAPGTGKRIRAGQWIRFNLHYQATGQVEIDQSRLGAWFSKVPVKHEVLEHTVGNFISAKSTEVNDRDQKARRGSRNVIVQGTYVGDAPMPLIPAHADNFRVSGTTPITEPVTIHSFWPHMHLRGKSLKWIVTWPDGREEVVLDVPNYDFNWQINYDFEVPLRLPAGSTISAVATYDNSLKNRYNPAPDMEVYWSQQSWDEMFSPHMVYTLDGQDLSKSAGSQP